MHIPRTRDAQFIKPRSALAYPLAICRIFKRWGVQMPGYRALAAAFAGLMRSYLAHHGPGSLAPRRAEPMKFSMMRDIYRAAPTVRVAGRVWSDDCHDVFIFRRLNVFLMYTAFRLGEATGPDPFLTFTHQVWSIRGTIVTDPTAAQLHSLRPGMDYAQVAPPLSKADQWGERNCPFMVTLTYSEEPENPAAQLRDLELRCRGSGPRSARALFPNAAGEPYAHATLCHLLKGILTFLYSEAVASVYTFHSYRSGLATALHLPACRMPRSSSSAGGCAQSPSTRTGAWALESTNASRRRPRGLMSTRCSARTWCEWRATRAMPNSPRRCAAGRAPLPSASTTGRSARSPREDSDAPRGRPRLTSA